MAYLLKAQDHTWRVATRTDYLPLFYHTAEAVAELDTVDEPADADIDALVGPFFVPHAEAQQIVRECHRDAPLSVLESWRARLGLVEAPTQAPAPILPDHPSMRAAVEKPSHYRLPSGAEALPVIAELADAWIERGLSGKQAWALGNALKYLWRAGAKDAAEQDLRKAREYLDVALGVWSR